jgi:DNA-binding XRE family transcriptional regulator
MKSSARAGVAVYFSRYQRSRAAVSWRAVDPAQTPHSRKTRPCFTRPPGRSFRVLSHFSHIILKANKPNMPVTNQQFNKIGDHILHRRNELGLRQKDVAHILKVNRATIIKWETKPRCRRLMRCWELSISSVTCRTPFRNRSEDG